MLIICCGMIRSGSTLQYQLVKEIIEKHHLGKAIGPISPEDFSQVTEKYSKQNEYYIVKCHNYIDGVKELFIRGEIKIIYVFRDIRDVIVSLMNKRQTTFVQVFISPTIRLALSNYFKWNNLGNIYKSKYEDMIISIKQEIFRISDHMGIKIDKSFAQKTAEKYSISNQINRIRDFDFASAGIANGKNKYDPESLLHENHISSGKAFQWKNILSHYEIALIENIAYDWLIKNQYEISENYLMRKVITIHFHFTSFINRFRSKLIKKY